LDEKKEGEKTLPEFKFWLSEDQVDILVDILDPFKNATHKKDYGAPYGDLLKLFQTAEVNIAS